MINIYNIEQKNYVNGTGCRYVLWVQGCSLGCKECWNKDSWNNNPNILKSVNEVFNEIQKLQNDIDGVTFTGGEPFEQVEQLSILAKMIKSINLDLHIFTGYEIDELVSNKHQKLLEYTDTLVYGRFDTTKENNNQKVKNFKQGKWQFNNSDIEIDIDKDGNLNLTGYPSDNFIKNMEKIDARV